MPFTPRSSEHVGATVVVTRDGSRTLAAPAGGEGYKSLAGAFTEARYVYLEGSGVAARLAAGRPTRVLEVGFGTGLVFLVSAALAESTGTPLDYVALELDPPPTELLGALAYDELLAPSPLPEELVRWRASLGQPVEDGTYGSVFGATHLDLVVGDARDYSAHDTFHAVYHDAFSPATSPELWTPAFLEALAARLEPGGRLVSFSVASRVRRALEGAGLTVEKRPGPPGGKREVLAAVRPG